MGDAIPRLPVEQLRCTVPVANENPQVEAVNAVHPGVSVRAPIGTRTLDLRIKSPELYQLSYRGLQLII